eukprot:TRINITY_DN32241_c0_g2_i1.p1 TRINITY_DN32241_c0_g2~~TRINITY_DN32241_c0_g2_i1.p1  ORF type:complete len:388 (-),score=82.68 TRINITY_DN32241_c0_g2_i1:172-1335(-)
MPSFDSAKQTSLFASLAVSSSQENRGPSAGGKAEAEEIEALCARLRSAPMTDGVNGTRTPSTSTPQSRPLTPATPEAFASAPPFRPPKPHGFSDMPFMTLMTADYVPEIEKAQRRSVLHWAAATGDMDMLGAILGGSDGRQSQIHALDQYGWSALHMAAWHGQANAVAMLLENPRFEILDHKDKEGRTALHLASRKGHLACVEEFLYCGRFTSVAAADRQGYTALHRAAAYGHLLVVLALLNSPRLLDACDAVTYSGGTALHYAAWNGHEEVVDAMLGSEQFTAVNLQDKDGYTALHRAAKQAQRAVMEVLLSSPRFTAVRARNSEGKTARDLCKAHAYSDLALIFDERSAMAEFVRGTSARLAAVERSTLWQGLLLIIAVLSWTLM